MSDTSDDDLLALAGEGAGDGAGESTEEDVSLRQRAAKQRGAADESEDDESDEDGGDGADGDDYEGENGDRGEDDEDEESEDERTRSRSRGGRRRRDAYEDSDVDDEDPDFVNPYPLEGKYKDEADRARLQAMPEIEREEILFDRSQEMQRYNERKYLAQRARERRQAEARDREMQELRESIKKDGGKSTKKTKLSELKLKRHEKHLRTKNRAEGIEPAHKRRRDESESEYSEGDGYGRRGDYDDDEYGSDDDRVEWADSAKEQSRELTAHDINKIRFGRTLLANYAHHPSFEDAVIGSFVRVNVGFNRDKQAYVYRVCRVKELATVKPYKFLNRTVDQSLVVTNGPSERTIEMGICSDKDVTEEEFKWWKDYMEASDLTLPSLRRLQKKYDELLAMQQRVLTPAEVDEMIRKRQSLAGGAGGGSTGTDIVVTKSMLQEQRAVALERNDFDALEEIDHKIEQIERVMNKNKRRSELDKLAKVNERNRRRNLDEIRRAEIRAQEQRRKALKEPNAGAASDPFSRHRTLPRLFYESKSQSATPAPETKAEKPVEESNNDTDTSVPPAKKTAAMDDTIASLDIDIEIEI